jgi:hypothetical protein
MKNIKMIKNEKQRERLEPGIKALLNNKECREKIIGFWLILSGLMYMYYSTVVVVPEILARDDITLKWNYIDQSSPLHQISDSILKTINLIEKPHQVVTLIILSTALIAHIIIGFVLHNEWKKKKLRKNKFIYAFFRTFEKIINLFYKSFSILFGHPNKIEVDNNRYSNDSKKNKKIFISNLEKHDLDVIIIKNIGFLLVIIGIINSTIFYFLIDKHSIYLNWIIVIFTAISTLVANSGWAIVPSMLASRFSTHFRTTGSSLAYNGGLAISFASPFIIMEFYLSIKSEYIIFIAMMLGAISMIIGAKRLMDHKDGS